MTLQACESTADASQTYHAWLPGPQDGDYDSCPVTEALLDLLDNEKSKEVRKAVVASLPVMAAGPEGPMASACTLPHILARTLDEADEVRRG